MWWTFLESIQALPRSKCLNAECNKKWEFQLVTSTIEKKNLSCGVKYPRVLKRLNQGKPAINQGCNSAGTCKKTVKNKPNHKQNIAFCLRTWLRAAMYKTRLHRNIH